MPLRAAGGPVAPFNAEGAGGGGAGGECGRKGQEDAPAGEGRTGGRGRRRERDDPHATLFSRPFLSAASSLSPLLSVSPCATRQTPAAALGPPAPVCVPAAPPFRQLFEEDQDAGRVRGDH